MLSSSELLIGVPTSTVYSSSYEDRSLRLLCEQARDESFIGLATSRSSKRKAGVLASLLRMGILDSSTLSGTL